MKRVSGGIFLVLALSAAGGAQSYPVHPAPYAGMEGEGSAQLPFAANPTPALRQVVYQQVHDNLSARPLLLKGIAFRRDGERKLAWAAWKAEVELVLAEAAPGVNSANLKLSFAANMGSKATTGPFGEGVRRFSRFR